MTQRRTALRALAAAGLAASAPRVFAQAAPWPSKTIKIVTPSPVGVGSDTFARAYADQLSKALGVAVIVENRPGAALTIGTDVVAKSPADGHTMLFSPSNPFTFAPFLFARLPYDAQRDLIPVGQTMRGGSFIVANPSLPASNLRELVALAKARPGSISFASYGPGSTAHIGFELVQDAAGIEMLHVPYKQSAMPDVIGGQVMLGFEPPVSALPNIKSGRVKAIAYTGSQRSPALPEVPTLAELYPGLEIFTWLGMWVPASTPAPVVRRLHDELARITRTPEMARRIVDAGLDPMTTSPEDTAAVISREAQAMGRVIKAKNIRLE